MIAPTIEIQFSCDTCGLKDHKLHIPARESEQFPVVEWMRDVVAVCVQDEHRTRSPQCRAEKITSLKIPIRKDGWIGQA